jgi:anti-sigma regulatory factor (Ser/Thr protein kinase)
MDTRLWPCRPLPTVEGVAWKWQLTSVDQLRSLRTELRRRLRSAPDDDEEVDEEILLAVDELASNGLRHGIGPVSARIVGTTRGWLIDISDRATGRCPEPDADRDPALGGMGLHIVARLSALRGWTVSGGSKHVWALLRRGRAPSSTAGRADPQPGALTPPPA